MRVLLLEDHAPLARTLRRLLTDSGHAAVCVETLPEVWAILAGGAPWDAVSLDVSALGDDPHAALRQVRWSLPRARIVLLSGEWPGNLARLAAEAGVVALCKSDLADIGVLVRALEGP